MKSFFGSGPLAAVLAVLTLGPATASAPILAAKSVAEPSTTQETVDVSKEGGSWLFNKQRAPKPPAASPAPSPAPAAQTAAAAPSAPAQTSNAKIGSPAAATAVIVAVGSDSGDAAAEAKQEAALLGETEQTVVSGRLKQFIDGLRVSPVAAEPNVKDYLDLAEKDRLTGAQLNDFAAFLGKKALVQAALEFQKAAVAKEPTNPTLWLNLGTLLRNVNRNSDALSAYRKSSKLETGNALAYYNIGATYDALGDYDKAVAGYRTALALDPTLGDPKRNPQVVNNPHLVAVSLLLYKERAGALGLPLLSSAPVPAKGSPPVPAPAAAPAPAQVPPPPKTDKPGTSGS